MAKLMTMAVVFNELKAGRLSLDDEFTISENAWRNGGANSGGSTMFAKLNSRVALSDLIRGVIVQSGNDASIAIAEGVAGSEDGFARMMNARAEEIGMTSSTFRNATGLPHPDQRVTARDLARLAEHIIKEYPEFYPIYSQTEFEWSRIPAGQPQSAAVLGHQRGRAEDGLHRGIGVRPCRLRGRGRPTADRRHQRRPRRRRSGRGSRVRSSTGASELSRTTG